MVDELQFNPDENELKFNVEMAPAEMSDDQRFAAAKHAVYETYRQMTAMKATVDYLAELVGIEGDEITAIGEQAEEDEVRDFGENEYDIADSYEDAAAGRTRPASR
jgi:hypothetical protein